MALGLAEQGATGGDEAAAPTNGALWSRRPRLGIILGATAILAVAVPLVLECFDIAVAPGRLPIYLGGDQALSAVATRAAAGWHQLLGPYDRFGWHHPGPAYFYLQSLPSHVLASGQTMFFGAAAINALSAALAVAVVWRRVGSRAALWSAICVGYLAIAFGPDAMSWPWNPYAVVLPLCLFAVLCAGASAGSLLCLLGSLLVGSYLVQTDVGTAPVVVVLLLLALVGLALRLRDMRPNDGSRLPPSTRVLALSSVGLAALIAMWVPPVIEQINGRPGNLTLLWRFFTSSHPDHGLSSAIHAVGSTDAQLGFNGASSSVLQSPHNVALIVSLVVAVMATVAGLWLRQTVAFSLGVASLVAQVVSILGATRIVGPIYGYLVVWELALPVVGAIGLGAAFLGDERRPLVERSPRWQLFASRSRTAMTLGLVSGTIAVATILGAKVTRLPPPSSASASDVGQAWNLVAPQVMETHGSVFVDIASHDSWTIAAGLTDQLQQRGLDPTVPGPWASAFGTGAVTGTEAAQVALYQRAEVPPTTPSGWSQLGTVGDTVIYFSKSPPAGHLSGSLP